MKKILLILFSIACFTVAKSQNIYSDALELTKFTKDSIFISTNKDTVFAYCTILKKYLKNPNETLNSSQIIKKYHTGGSDFNPILSPMLPDKAGNDRNIGTQSADNATNMLPSIGNLDVTGISDALARFLIKRGKEELNVAFFSKLTKFLDKYQEAKRLFPKSNSVLSHIDPTRYAEMIHTIRKAFDEDLQKIPENAYKLVDLPKYAALDSIFPELGLVLRSANSISILHHSGNPVQFSSDLLKFPEWEKLNTNLGNGFKAMDVISNSLTDSSGKSWITQEKLNNLISNPIQFKLYIGLLYAKSEGIVFKENNGAQHEFRTFLNAFNSNQEKIKTILRDIHSLEVKITTLASDFSQHKDSLNEAMIFDFLNRIIDISKSGATIADTVYPGLIDATELTTLIKKYLESATHGIEIYKYSKSKDYSSAIFSMYRLLKDITEDVSFDSLKNAELKKFPGFVEKFLTFGNFIAGIVKAESPDQIQQVIEASALPAGSYSVKQKSDINVSLNGYLGYNWDFRGYNKPLLAQGLYAPIGISINKGLAEKHGGALTVFFSFIDIGAVVSYRVSAGVTDSIKQVIRLESIYSPGIQFFYVIPRTPFTLGFGGRFTPKLFFSDDNRFITIPSKDVLTVSALIDIPIFTLYNKRYKH